MLVLSRKKKESLVIDGDIRVFVIDIKGDSVRLGIEAAKSVPVHRNEVFERIVAGQPKAMADLRPLSQPGRGARRDRACSA